MPNANNSMEYVVLTIHQISVCYYQTELTRSHNQNFLIIRQHWNEFNNRLRTNKVKLGLNWEKYAITKKRNDRYFYQCAFPSTTEIPQFKFTIIPGGHYVKFDHKGSMKMIKSTINEIYNNVIPRSHTEIDINRSLIHFERYDSRFNWNGKDSVIELYVPIMN